MENTTLLLKNLFTDTHKELVHNEKIWDNTENVLQRIRKLNDILYAFQEIAEENTDSFELSNQDILIEVFICLGESVIRLVINGITNGSLKRNDALSHLSTVNEMIDYL